MTSSIKIQASSHDYDVFVGEGIRHNLLDLLNKEYANALVITDDRVAEHYLEDVKNSLEKKTRVSTAVVPSGEASKCMAQYEELLNRCIEAQLDRHSLIVALGGGMVGDLAGFTASTYLRGVDYIQIPTTILAHDSSVGGKVAINHSMGKNLIGSFYNPKMVVYDIETLLTLPEKEKRSGYGEVIKHAFLSDAHWCRRLLERSLSDLTNEEMKTDLMKGIRVKASIVEEDEKEAGIRKYLNLGHTLAHAIEAELGYGEITHGEAVALGLLFALKLSEKHKGAALPIEEYVDWLEMNNYPLSVFGRIDAERMVERMKWDKKTVNQMINFVLLESTGSPCVEQMEDHEISSQLNLLIREVSSR
ncbi:3-dehydroquinate synthase [Halobacillus litoralis]|uniref:3-dehydroquinate synthase n=1 Tax=Halobacillus litoralis TaxID=45668 RepID=UPI001CFDE3AB|nr:3-dehydroquinate synthase [Halobacillus litoralis]